MNGLPSLAPGNPKQYRLVTLYPQSHHPALAMNPIILESQNELGALQDFEKKKGQTDNDYDMEQLQATYRAFARPMDRKNTVVLMPVPVDY